MGDGEIAITGFKIPLYLLPIYIRNPAPIRFPHTASRMTAGNRDINGVNRDFTKGRGDLEAHTSIELFEGIE